jgi:glutathione synthase/RimK-type ligase-like ATP-grasp enzyme
LKPLVVVENVSRWPLRLEGAEVVSARSYLVDPAHAERRGVRVYNLCRRYGYQTLGYYVSLLAAARGHRPMPSVETLQDLRLSPIVRIASEELEELIARSLSRLRSERFELSIYFGRNLAKQHDALARAIFNQFPAPFLRASFVCQEGDWRLHSVRLIASSDIPEAHRDFVIEQAAEHFGRRHRPRPPRQQHRYEMAILADTEADDAPSDERAIRKFVRAAQKLDIDAELVTRDDYGSIAEFDALFIRETTAVDHHTYRFARRAAAEGLVVVDDPESILRCTNKVYQAELFGRHGIASPKTLVVHGENVDEVQRRVGLPCVLKRPDSSFSQGVVKVEDEDELRVRIARFLEDSELVIAQEYAPSSFDWRIGVLDGTALYACRYHMAKGHWQVIATAGSGRRRYGKVETIPLEAAPAQAVSAAVRAAQLIGDGLYGVDVKELNGRTLVMEVNDNPNLESGYEDAVLGDGLYLAIMSWFRQRLDARGSRRAP